MTKSSSPFFIKLFHSRWFYIVNLVLVLIVTVSFTRELIHGHDIATQIQTLQKQSQALQTQHLAIADLKNAVQTETFVEQEARLKLGLKKPGENVVILKNEKTANTQSDSGVKDGLSQTDQSVDDSGSQKPLANSTKWWYYFFNKQAYLEAKTL